MAADPKPTRKRRPVAARTAPIRSGFAAQTTGARGGEAPEGSVSGDVQRVIQDAVRIGYDVVGANLDQARDAAQRMSSGQYAVKDVPDDLARLGERLLGLTRDLGATWLDVMGMVLRDPRLGDLMRGSTAGTGHRQPDPPGPLPPGWNPGHKAARETYRSVPVEVVVQFAGPVRRHTARAAPLSHGEPGIIPTIRQLDAVNSTAPPLPCVLAMPAATTAPVIAHVEVPADQPAGTYVGVITDQQSMPIGMVEVTLA